MKILTRKQFIALEGEVVFCTFIPYVFGPVQIRTAGLAWDDPDSIGDFVEQDLTPDFNWRGSGEMTDILDTILAGQPSPPMVFDSTCRNGMFDAEDLYAVFERDDVARLIARLTDTLFKTPERI